MINRKTLPAALLSGAILVLVPQAITAQQQPSAYFSSSMKAQCIIIANVPCAQIRFTLDVDGINRLTEISIRHNSSDIWDFESVQSIISADGQSAGWTTKLWEPEHIAVELAAGNGLPVAEPLYVTINMGPGTTGDGAKLHSGYFKYSAYGYEGVTGDVALVAHGTVTPEPVTMTLLATGLLGLGGAGVIRRRKKGALVDE